MQTVNLILVLGIGLGMIGTLISLIVGLFAMASNDEKARARSNSLMRTRVAFQFLAITSGVLYIALNLVSG